MQKTYSNSECALVDGASNSRHRLSGVGAGGALLHPLCPHLQLRLAEVGDHPLTIDAQEFGNLLEIRL